MKSENFNRGMAILRASYPQSRVEFTDDIREVWFAALQDLDDESFAKAIRDILKKEVFFPAIAIIREYSARYTSIREVKAIAPPVTVSAERRERNKREVGKILTMLTEKTGGQE